MSTGIEPEDLKALLDAFDRSDWQEMTVSVEGDAIQVSRSPDGFSLPVPGATAPPVAVVAAASPTAPAAVPAAPEAAPAPVPTPAAALSPPAAAAAGVPVASPSVGLFWVAPAPGTPPFVEVGSRVEVDDTVGIVEVMKLMNHVSAGVAGVVTAVAVENGAPVEFGQPLVFVDPGA